MDNRQDNKDKEFTGCSYFLWYIIGLAIIFPFMDMQSNTFFYLMIPLIIVFFVIQPFILKSLAK